MTSARHILKIYRQATADERAGGRVWYKDAHDLARSIAEANGLTVDTVAGILAALSPSVAWDDNVSVTRELIHTGKVRVYGGYRANLRKAERILAGENPRDVLGGHKVTAFYRLIRDGGNDVDVVVDAHAASIADGKHYLWKQGPRLRSLKQYGARAEAYRRAARKLDLDAHAVQAITWLAWKRIKHEREAVNAG
jgi:hypothetical protein